MLFSRLYTWNCRTRRTQMENMDKFLFPDPAPIDNMTLLDLCFRAVAKDFSRYDHDALIADLPVHLVHQLKSYMTPRMLHNIMPLLEKRGIDTSHEWKTFASQDPYLSLNIRGRPMDPFLITTRSVNELQHAYIARHCQDLLYDLFKLKQGKVPYRYERQDTKKVPTEKDIREDLLFFLPSVVNISINLDIFRKLHLELKIMETLIDNLEALTIGDIGWFACSDEARLTVSGAERISRILKTFCRSKVLKSIKFECGLCYDEWEWDRDNVSIILRGLDASGTDEIASVEEASALSSFEEDIESCEGKPYWMDDEKEKLAMERIHKEDESWTDFQEILKAIEKAIEYAKTSDTVDKIPSTPTLEAISLCINCFLHVGKYLPGWKSARRLSFVGSVVSNEPLDGLAREILKRIACHQLTHLELYRISCGNLVSRILYIFHEYYTSKTEATKEPMEWLDTDANAYAKGGESLPVFKDTVYAVKCYRGSLFGVDNENFSAFLTFLKYNACLTHLQLGFQHISVSCVRILDTLLDSKVLETLVLTGYPIAHKDGINKADSLVDFLNNVKTLTKLSLKSCCIEGDTVSSKDLIQSIQKHQHLKKLHLEDNDMGSAGATFLTALLMPEDGVALNLKELDLNYCNIPAEDLLVAAETLKTSTDQRPLIESLKIGSYVFKGDDGEKTAMKEMMKKEYSELAKCLHADFFGYNPFDPDSSDYDDYDQYYSSDQDEMDVNGEYNDVNIDDNDVSDEGNDVNGEVLDKRNYVSGDENDVRVECNNVSGEDTDVCRE